jgi:hypothetical protein
MLHTVAGEEEEGTTIAPAQVVTEEVPAFRDEQAIDRPIDPWLELTDAGEDDDADPEVLDALGWVEKSDPPDGPVPAPVDAAPAPLPDTADLEPPGIDTFERAPRQERRSADFERELRSGPDLGAYLRDGFEEPRPRASSQRGALPRAPSQRGGMNQPVVIQRKVAKPRQTSVRPQVSQPKSKAPPREYPRMLSLLKDASALPSGGRTDVPPPPVPGTFFPAPRAPIPRPPPQDLDEMLATMAEGLLIGEAPDGGTEVRVTLKDEFFAGTELRIRVGDGKVNAILIPPDRTTYWQLNGNIEQLRERLSSRGLTVEAITVEEPST